MHGRDLPDRQCHEWCVSLCAAGQVAESWAIPGEHIAIGLVWRAGCFQQTPGSQA